MSASSGVSDLRSPKSVVANDTYESPFRRDKGEPTCTPGYCRPTSKKIVATALAPLASLTEKDLQDER